MSTEQELLSLIGQSTELSISGNKQSLDNHLDATDRILGQLAARTIIAGASEVASSKDPLLASAETI